MVNLTTSPEQKTAPGVGVAATKNRAWGFFGDTVRQTWEIDPQVVDTHLARTTTYSETAPGVPHWPSRDPISERGGLNLYAMVRNSVVNWVDMLGLAPLADGGPFDNVDEAGLDGVSEAVGEQRADRAHFEYSGAICCKGGEIRRTIAVRGTHQNISEKQDCPEGWKLIGTYHSHPTHASLNSTDALSTSILGVPMYVGGARITPEDLESEDAAEDYQDGVEPEDDVQRLPAGGFPRSGRYEEDQRRMINTVDTGEAHRSLRNVWRWQPGAWGQRYDRESREWEPIDGYDDWDEMVREGNRMQDDWDNMTRGLRDYLNNK